ncbi:hypothetical protein Desor_1521 [Desulfosporosinus orientis DSM 765]|uniref:Uncharacterized protein n=1 Tax=Desulfosporosinus orientis (strain ATCC 19365 / DSM 765 / NCIMB 8382 / VKM B-1628 / Singapore I) TaxID=768706 RepID=G7WAW5_DESOD|nr:hypothetical protein [Desulfosporosinus orientis]AET67176.1 hypothetical protein Desor_1521 [Desulfosporosinus orientis DSM 765]
MGLVILSVILFNIPFGYWRGYVRKFSGHWFLSIHLPVPVIACLRLSLGLGWDLRTFLMFVAAYGTGQWLGVKWHRHWRKIMRVSGCLFRDILWSRWIILISRS